MSTETEFFLALSLTPEDRKKFQVVYSSQLYGTFFSVYACFKFTDTKVGGDFELVTFKIHNYKGPINIGIKEVVYDSTEQQFLITVQGLGESKDDFEKVATFKNGISFSASKPMKFERKLVPLNDRDSDSNHMPFKHGFFDSEFYKRDGDCYLRRPKDEVAFDNNPDVVLRNGLPSNPIAPGNQRCIRSTSYIRI